MHKIEVLSETYILLDSLLFKLNVEKEKAVLAIPEICVDQIIALYCARTQSISQRVDAGQLNVPP